MANFFYKATDTDGRWLSGQIEGATREEAARRLAERGMAVESLDEVEDGPSRRGGSTSRAELVELVEHLAALTRSGLPLPSGLRAAGMEVASRSHRATFFEVADLVEAGDRLDDALGRAGGRFPADLRAVILAGSRSGRLAEMLAEYVRAENLRSELRRVFISRLAYPAVLLVLVILLVGLLCALSARTAEVLGSTMKEFGVDQPSLVQALGTTAAFINEHEFEILAALVTIPILAWLTLSVGFGPAARRRIVCSIPVVGPVLRFGSLTGFCHLLAMLLEAETPLPLAFELAGSCVGDADVAVGCARMGEAIDAGEPLVTAMGRWTTIPAGLGQLFGWSEGESRLPGALHLAGDMFESRARSQSNYAGNVLATVMLLLILWWIGFAIVVLYLPLMTMIQMIGRLAG